MQRRPVFINGKISYCSSIYTYQCNVHFQCFPQNPSDFFFSFIDLGKKSWNSKNHQTPSIAKTILRNENKVGDTTLPDLKVYYRASLVAQWLEVCLPMQGTRVWALVWEDPTCRGANRPVSHNYWACASGACAPPTREATIVRGPHTVMKSGPRLPQLEKALAQKRRPNTAKKLIN